MGGKYYEVKDHLGNVRLVFSDLKDVNIGTTTRYRYNLDVRAVNNYYPFGMLMPDMSWQSSGYRYGYNGMEMDNDIKGTGNHSSFGDYGYDPRTARRYMLEPMIAKYPSLSPYVAYADNPINFKDPDGRAVLFINGQHSGSGGTSSYWEGYDRKISKQFRDYNSHFIDGAMGGWDNTIHNPLYDDKIVPNNILAKNRYDSGKEWTKRNGLTFILSLDSDETIKVVTHSMGAATARGVIDGLNEVAKALEFVIQFEILLDVEAYQGEDLKIPMLDGNVIFEEGQHFSKLGGLSKLPTVSQTPNSSDASSDNERKNAGHTIKDFDTKNLPKLDSKTSGEKNKTEGYTGNQ